MVTVRASTLSQFPLRPTRDRRGQPETGATNEPKIFAAPCERRGG
jgi:hypothetical protein